MNASTAEMFAERLARLERENRFLRWIGASLFLGLVVLITTGTGLVRRETLRASRLELRDRQGVVRARLGIDDLQAPRLSFFDRSGKEQLTMIGSDNATSIEMMDRGQLRIALTSSNDGSATLHFFDGNWNVPSAFYIWADGSSGLFLSCRENPIHLSVKPNGEARLSVLDAEFRERSYIALSETALITQRTVPSSGDAASIEGIISTSSPAGGDEWSKRRAGSL